MVAVDMLDKIAYRSTNVLCIPLKRTLHPHIVLSLSYTRLIYANVRTGFLLGIVYLLLII